MNVGGITLDTRRLDEIAKGLDMNTDQVLRSLAFQVEAEAKKVVPRDPARPPLDPSQPVTGALRSSIKTTKKGKNLYWVHDGVEYGICQEFGTSRGVPPRPFMVPSVEKVRKYLADRFKGLFK